MGITIPADKRRFNQLRQSLAGLSEQVTQIAEPFLSGKSVIKGSAYELKTKCGKPGCKCAKGRLHSRMVLSASEKGKTKLRAIPHGFLVEIQTKVRRYQQLRRARARLVEVHKEMLKVMDQIEAMRREEMPAPKERPVTQ